MNFQKQMIKHKLALIGYGLGAMGIASQAAAQIEEIVVTAQKRSESVQDIPVAISAFDEKSIRELGIASVTDLTNHAPNMAFQDTGIGQTLNIRGVSQVATTDANESNVAVYMDGVYIGSPINLTAALYDLERIEVLRGPQGTLYGRNSNGGLANFISRRPTEEFEGYVSAEVGNYGKVVIEGAVSGELSDGIRGRLAVRKDTDDGWQENIINGDDWNETDIESLRAQLAFDLNQDATLLLNANVTNSDSSYGGFSLNGLLDPSGSGSLCSASPSSIRDSNPCITSFGENAGSPDPEDTQSDFTSAPKSDKEQYGLSAQLDWDFGQVTLTALSSFVKIDSYLENDGDGSVTAGVADFFSNNNATYQITEYEQFSQEIRLSQVTDTVDWVAGIYYFDSETDAFGQLGHPSGFFGTTPLGDSTIEKESWAIFGDAKFKLSDQLTLAVGLRYTDEEQEHTGELFPGTPFAAFFPPFSFDTDEDPVTGRLALEWSVTEDAMIYASYARGFKSPAFNAHFIGFFGGASEAAPSETEEIDSFELGLKSQWLKNTLQLNAALFYYQYDGVQQTLSAPSPSGQVFPRLDNFGDADVFGAEIELNYVPNDRWQFAVGVGVLDTEVDSSQFANTQPLTPADDPATPGINESLSPVDGNELANAPELSYNLMAKHIVPLGDNGKISFQLGYNWRDDIFFGVDNNPYEAQESFGLLDARISWTSVSESLVIEVFGNNLTDEEYFIHGFVDMTNGAFSGIWGKPATYGARATYSF